MAGLTTKDLQELSELLDSENLAYRKCCNYMTECCDPVLKSKLGMWANNHRNRFETLYNFLNGQN